MINSSFKNLHVNRLSYFCSYRPWIDASMMRSYRKHNHQMRSLYFLHVAKNLYRLPNTLKNEKNLSPEALPANPASFVTISVGDLPT